MAEITIRVLNPQTQRVKFVFPSIANNKQLMKNMGFIISDPQYDAKMHAFTNKIPFSENGQTKVPTQESFAPKIEPVKIDPIVTQPKNEIEAPAIIDEPKIKRTRRTKEQMKAARESLKKQKA